MKKTLALLLAVVMVFGLAACGGSKAEEKPAAEAPAQSGSEAAAPAQTGGSQLAGTYDITVWCPDAEVELRKAMIEEFNKSNEDGIVFNATVQNVGEGEAATQMITDVEAGADLYNFASDQFARLVQANALAKLGVQAAEVVKSGNGAAAVDAIVKGGNMIMASHNTAAVEWFAEMSENSDPMIKAGGSRSLLILEAFFWGEQKTNGTIEVAAGAPKAIDREPKAWQKRADYWRTRRDYVALAWAGELKVRRGAQKRTDDEKLQQAARVIARLIKNDKATLDAAIDAINAQLATLKAAK